jgi:hypothetical protein
VTGPQLAARPRVLAEDAWRALERAHEARADRLVAAHLGRAGRRAHPVEDFLFTYYSLRPARLRRWHPGAGMALAGAGERLSWRDHADLGGGAVGLDVAAFAERRGGAVRHIRALLEATAQRPPQLGCFGLHEWAMVYRQPADEVRHAAWPLRLGPAGTDAVVEGHRIRCSHHDAFRFFTPDARPLNALQPGRADGLALEQPGCLHATMDLYKWAYKLGPAVPGELLLDCFELARDTRLVDMRAAPYDLRGLGVEPIPIETPAGKAAYVEAQRGLAARAAPLRGRLVDACDAVLGPFAGVSRAPSGPPAAG